MSDQPPGLEPTTPGPMEGSVSTILPVNRRRRIPPAAKFGILVAFVLAAGGLYEWLQPPPKPKKNSNVADKQITTGTKLLLPGEDWASNHETLVIVMAVGCDYCEAMVPFYKDLTSRVSDRKDLKVVAALPQSVEESKDFLSDAGLDISDVKQVSLKSISVTGTPTVIVVDQTGTVTDTWLGTMNETQKTALLNKLKANPLAPIQ